MTPFHAARSSVATVRITMTKSAVAMISSTSAAQSSIPLPGCVWSASVTSLEYTIAITRTAPNPPTSCATQYGTTSRGENLPAIASPALTAGLKCPPEMCPNAVIASARPNPNPAATPIGVIASTPMSTTTAIPLKPRKKKRKVPRASAASRTPSG